MKCPNCGRKWPLSFLGALGFGDVGLRKSFDEGYCMCQHCGALLKQEEYGTGLTKWQKGVWFFFAVHAFFVAITIYLFVIITSYTESSLLATIFLLLFLTLLAIPSRWYFFNKYALVKEVDKYEETNKSRGLKFDFKDKGSITLISYMLVAVFLFIFYVKYALTYILLNKWYILMGVVLGTIALLAGALAIFRYFSTDVSEDGPADASQPETGP